MASFRLSVPRSTVTTTSTSTAKPTLFIESARYFFAFEPPIRPYNLIALSDGSFVTCSFHGPFKRWLVSTTDENTMTLECIGTFGERVRAERVVEIDNNTLVSSDHEEETMQVWNIKTCKCLSSIVMSSRVLVLMMTKDKTTLLCGL